MNFDIALFLVVLSALTGVIWLLDILVLAQKRQAQSEQSGKEVKEPFYVDYARSLFPVFFIVLVLRSFIFEPFRIPSQSMMPTLWVGDFILVSKFSYGVRLPVLNTEIIDSGKPERGDVAVFRYPKDPAINYIKRVIGIPGDHIIYKNKLLTVNGVKVPEKFLGLYVGQGSGTEMNNALYQEEDLTGIKHKILIRQQAHDYTMQYSPELTKGHIIDFTVPEGQYYVMGDNRDNSNDGRVWGMVPDKNLVGRARLVWLNFTWKNWFDFGRVAKKL
jgi:signal peptidase I